MAILVVFILFLALVILPAVVAVIWEWDSSDNRTLTDWKDHDDI